MTATSRRVRRAARVALLALPVLVAAGGCATTEEPGPSSTAASGPEPAGTVSAPPTTVDLVARLLPLEEVRPLAAFGLDIREQPVLDPEQFTLGTLRGPCGATVETPFDESGAFRVFRSTAALVVEALAEPGAAEAQAFVDALEADATAGCPAFTEQLGSAEPSTITLRSMIDPTLLEDGWVGWTQEVADSGGPVGHRAILVGADGDRLWLLAVLSPAPIADPDLAGLARLAAQRAGA